MSEEFLLAGESINVNAFSGFDRPDDVQVVNLLWTPTSTHDSVVQQSSKPSPIATLSGRTSDYEQVELLREWRDSHGITTLQEPDGGTHAVIVLTLEVHKVPPTLFLWEWTMTCIELAAGSLGSGS